MKLFRKKILKGGLVLISIACALVWVVYFIGNHWLYNNSWRHISTTDEMIYNASLVEESPALTNDFYRVYDLVKPNQRKTTMIDQLWNSFANPHDRYDCKCDDIGYLAWNNPSATFKFNQNALLKRKGYWYFGFGLENYSSTEKCFDYFMNNNIYWKNKYLKDLNELSIVTLKKELSSLDDHDIILLIAIFDGLNISGNYDKDYVSKRYDVLLVEYYKNKK